MGGRLPRVVQESEVLAAQTGSARADISFITASGSCAPASSNIPQAHQGRYHYSHKFHQGLLISQGEASLLFKTFSSLGKASQVHLRRLLRPKKSKSFTLVEWFQSELEERCQLCPTSNLHQCLPIITCSLQIEKW